MRQAIPGLPGLTIKTMLVHTTTYFVMGLLASSLFNYTERFARPDMICWLRQLDDPLVLAGPLFQPIRGLIFALVFYPLREILFGKRYGWLIMWWMLVGLGILGPFGATVGSVEGLIYSVVSIPDQLVGWLEVIPQALLLSLILYYWVQHPQQRWLNWAMGLSSFVVILLPTVGLLMG